MPSNYRALKVNTLNIPVGNTKIGFIPNFSLPTPKSCSGATPFCKKHCYMNKYKLFRPSVIKSHNDNWNTVQSPFAHLLIPFCQQIKTFRIHVSGDFFSTQYIQEWIKIIKTCPQTKFYAYTHSWNNPELLPILNKLKALPNMQLFASIDPNSIPPKKIHSWRKAYIGSRKGAKPCTHDQKKTVCALCGFCWNTTKGSLYFKQK